MTYENKRVIFTIILRKYRDYQDLYRAVNNGSIQGVTSFEDFYWQYTYYSRYSNGKINDSR